MQITDKQAEWSSLAKKIRDRIEDPDDHANSYNLIIEGLWECERKVEEQARAHVSALEAQVAAERVKWEKLRGLLKDYSGHSCDDDHQLGEADAYDTVWKDMDRLDNATADVVKVTIDDVGTFDIEFKERVYETCNPGDIVYFVRTKEKP
jgi:hypothetical protein